MTDFQSLEMLAEQATQSGMTLSALTLSLQTRDMKQEPSALRERMRHTLEIMRESAANGQREARSAGGLCGGFAERLLQNDAGLLGKTAHRAAALALAISEHNACMGRIVAAPTAGSCGILPGVLLALGETHRLDDDRLTDGLFNAAAVGMVIAHRATLSGAKGGCAAECGSAGAMAACAAVELLGGSPQMCVHAVALALKAVMGLVCDPVAGLVEVPCVKRNATGAVLALAVAQLALAGIPSAIPADEVIDAMRRVGALMHESLRETSKGGIAATKTAQQIEKRLKGGEKA